MAARLMDKAAVKTMLVEHWPSFLSGRETAIGLDAWVTGTQYEYSEEAGLDPKDPFFGQPYSPKGETTEEYQQLSRLSPQPLGGLLVATLGQTAIVKGVNLPGKNERLASWRTWQQNRMDSRQVPYFRGAIGHGSAYAKVLPGKDPLTGEAMAAISLRSAKRMAAFYDDDNDEWPRFAIEAQPYIERSEAFGIETKRGWTATVTDEVAEHFLSCEGNGRDKADWKYIESRRHDIGVCPVVRCAASVDLDGKTTGVIEPVLPLLRRIDQDVFDRLIVQRFGAWAIRYIAGLAKPSNPEEAKALEIAMRVDDLLISDNPLTKFGTLDGTPLDGFIGATDADMRMLAAITQTPPHHLLGLSANLQAEALDAAEQGLKRKSTDFKLHAGESVEQIMRLCAIITKNAEEARAFDMQVDWADTEAQSFQSTAQALGMVATQLGVPVEMLWERLPNWTDNDTERAKRLVEDGTFDRMVREILAGSDQQQSQQGAPSGDQQ